VTDVVTDTERLERAWSTSPGLIGFLGAVNHKNIGTRFIVTSFGFLLIGGLQALVMRLQLGTADNDVLGPEAYNQAFTMHGTTMMFLFAVPMLEGLSMYLIPLKLGARDLPFPRLNAFGYWAYVFGGLLLYWSFVSGSVPDGGWFAYPPLTSTEYSPGTNLDYWLLGVTFVEISGIVGAIEIVVLVLRHKAPGMSLARLPLFVWSTLVMAVMMLFAFPAVIAASVLLEVERKFGFPFYEAAGGGNPLLWQHLFWIFGHPEVYIMLIPATGIVSAIVPIFSRRRIAVYPAIVASLIAIAILSFGLWVHHMFAVGLPMRVLAFFAISSILIAIPSGVQVFAWLATLHTGRPRWDTPLLYVAGFIFIFVLGGVTGVMVAAAPFDLQAHDSYFVVAHFHYVLFGGVVFPIFAALHHWLPKMTGKMPSERIGKLSFWPIFVGFNVTFFPQHFLGFMGMPRRVYTYRDGLGWETLNLISTVGSFLLAAGVLLFTANLLWAWRRGPRAPADPWGGDTLEWLASSPPAPANFTVPPVVGGRHPMWEPIPEDVVPEARPLLDAMATTNGHRRDQVVTGVVDGRVEGMVNLAGPTTWPLWSAAALTVALVGVLIDSLPIGVAGAVLLVGTLIGWLRPGDESGGGEVLTAPGEQIRTAGWWGAVFAIVAISTVVFFLLYAYVYLSITVGDWPPEGVEPPGLAVPGLIALLLVAAAACTNGLVARSAAHDRHGVVRRIGAACAFGTAAAAGIVRELLAAGLDPAERAYDGIVVVLGVTAVLLVASAAVLSLVVAAEAGSLTLGWLSSSAQVCVVWGRSVTVLVLVIGAVVNLWPQVIT
jgi:cytochrome c oxidase subunit I